MKLYKPFLIMIIAGFTIAAHFAGVVPALEPLFDFIETSNGVTSSDSPMSASIIQNIRAIVFIYAPVLFMAIAVFFGFLYAVQNERSIQ